VSGKRVVMMVFCLACAVPLMAQRRGTLEMGGSLYFHSGSGTNVNGNSQINFDWIIASYMSRNYAFEFEPNFQVTFAEDSINVGSLLLMGIGKRLADLSPTPPRDYQYRKYELGTAASVFGSVGAGMWISGVSLPTRPGENHTGPAVYAGISTRTYLGNMTSLRVNIKYAYLFPSGKVYTQARTLWQIGVGFAVFLRS